MLTSLLSDTITHKTIHKLKSRIIKNRKNLIAYNRKFDVVRQTSKSQNFKIVAICNRKGNEYKIYRKMRELENERGDLQK